MSLTQAIESAKRLINEERSMKPQSKGDAIQGYRRLDDSKNTYLNMVQNTNDESMKNEYRAAYDMLREALDEHYNNYGHMME